ncbi:MAG: class I SAM-dependent methyltransferase, partial [Rhodospirillaceae bacterium]
QLTRLTALSVPVAGAAVIEIGTGWKPILPLMYRLCGAAKVITVDQERLLDIHQAREALAFIIENRRDIGRRAQFALPLSFDNVCWDDATLDTFLTNSHIEYLAPYNFMNLPEASADIIVSRDVFEHVPEATLAQILAHSHRVLRPGGVMCHTIDMSDHWQHFDKTISPVNFLKYDSLLWRLACLNSQNYQNRLRQFEYLSLFKGNQFEVLSATGTPSPAASEALKTLPINERYRSVSHDELAILSTTIVARRK